MRAKEVLILIVLSLACVASAQITKITSAGALGTNPTSPAINTTGASLIAVGCERGSAAIGYATVTDSKGNTWLPGGTYYGSNLTGDVSLQYVSSPTTATNHTFTCGNSAYGAITVLVFSGTNTTTPYDKTVGNGSNANTGNLTPAQTGELLISLGGSQDSTGSTPFGLTNGFTVALSEHDGSNADLGMAYLVDSSSSAISTTWNLNGDGDVATLLAAFYPAAVQPTAATPTLTPGTGTYTSTQTVTVSSSTTGAVICYTTDLSTPTGSAGTCTHGSTLTNGGTVSVSASETLQAVATLASYQTSSIGSAVYTINICPVPTFSPTGGPYSSAQTVTISDSLSAVTMCYTTDLTTPTESGNVCTHGTTYSVPINVPVTETVNVLVTKAGYGDNTGSATYTIGASASALHRRVRLY